MVLLYNLPSSLTKKPLVPMSLLALAAVIDGGEDCHIIDGNLESDPAAALDRAVRETAADSIGVTVMPGYQLDDAVATCRVLKQKHPHLTIVWGGYFPTQHWDACLRAPYVDFVVRGHGEVAFRDLLRALRHRGDPLAVEGVAGRDDRGEPSSCGRADIPHPEEMPDFPYAAIPVERYVRRTFMGSRTLPHHSSYGCPFLCNFCAVVNMVDGRWKAQSAQRTAAVTRRLATEFGANAVEFYDNNFFVRESRTRELELERDMEYFVEPDEALAPRTGDLE